MYSFFENSATCTAQSHVKIAEQAEESMNEPHITSTSRVFTSEVIRIVSGIPPGAVLTYGEVAELAGSPRASRQVVRVLNTQSTIHRLPWHRVVGKGSAIRLPEESGGALQRSLLESEGWQVENMRLLSNAKSGENR